MLKLFALTSSSTRTSFLFDERPPMKASGIRIGTPACTTREMKEDEMKQIAHWIAQVLKDPTDETIELVKNEVIELCQ